MLVTVSPDLNVYPKNTQVNVQAIPNPGYILYNDDWTNRNLFIDEDESYIINTLQDNRDFDDDGLTNYQEAIIYNSNLNNTDSDYDNSSDYFSHSWDVPIDATTISTYVGLLIFPETTIYNTIPR